MNLLLKTLMTLSGLAVGAALGFVATLLILRAIVSCHPNEFCMGEPYIGFLLLLVMCPLLGILFAILGYLLGARGWRAWLGFFRSFFNLGLTPLVNAVTYWTWVVKSALRRGPSG